MLDLLELFRTRLAGRPLLLVFGVLAVLLVFARQRQKLSAASPAVIRFITAAAVAGILAYPSVAIWYVTDQHFFDNAEPMIPSVAWMYHLGQPLYPGVDAPERYAHIYGPVVFIAQGIALAVLGPSIWVSKAVGAVAGLASLAFVFAAARRRTSRRRAIVLTGLCALVLLTFRHYSFWNRPDPLQLLAVAVAVFCAGLRQRWASTILVGIASGILWNLKFTGPAYSLPVFALLYSSVGAVPIAVSLAIALPVALLPFVVLPNVSLVDYMSWVRLSGNTGLLLSTLRQNLEWAAFLALPLLPATFVRPQDTAEAESFRLAAGALVVGICGVVLAAAKPGAGPYHLIPFIPIVTYLVAHRVGHSPLVALDRASSLTTLAFVAVAFFIAVAQQAQLVTTMLGRRETREMDDVVAFLRTHPGVVEMAYGRTEVLSHARPLLAFRNNSYLIDQPAVREHQLQGVTIPAATIDAIAHCRVDYWLVPKGEPPFSGINSYGAMSLRPLYPDTLRRAFYATHVRGEGTAYYDVWECRGEARR